MSLAETTTKNRPGIAYFREKVIDSNKLSDAEKLAVMLNALRTPEKSAWSTADESDKITIAIEYFKSPVVAPPEKWELARIASKECLIGHERLFDGVIDASIRNEIASYNTAPILINIMAGTLEGRNYDTFLRIQHSLASIDKGFITFKDKVKWTAQAIETFFKKENIPLRTAKTN